MKKLYAQSELSFAIACIVIYCILQSLANPLNAIIGIECAANALFLLVLAIILFHFIRKNGLLERYGLWSPSAPARRFLYYIPLLILSTSNLWNGVAVNLPWLDALCYISYMLCVGWVEEVLFRGFLFRALAKDHVKKAILLSSITFGLGHLLHLINGSGAELVATLCQAFGAIAIGFLFVLVFYRGGSLIPCILTHSAIDAISVFGNEAGLTVEKRIIFSLIKLAIIIVYALILNRILPKKSALARENAPM